MNSSAYNNLLSPLSFPPSSIPKIKAFYSHTAKTEGYWKAFSDICGYYYVNCGTRLAALSFSRYSTKGVYAYQFKHNGNDMTSNH